MVAYCCVKGCSNNSSNKKKNPNDMTSFHAFPSNVEMKQKWLKAIGRPDWLPPAYARICSVHFSYEQINHDGRRIRIKDDAVPLKDLPVNSNFEASDVEVCRFCLATDIRLYSLQDGVHRVYLESLVNNENYKLEGLPHFVCFECAAHLKKCYNLLEKSLTVQATLLDIFAQYGKITTNLINSKNRKELNLMSPLNKHEINRIYEFKHNYGSDNDEDAVNDREKVQKTDDNYISIPKLEVTDLMIIQGTRDTVNCQVMEVNVDENHKFQDDKLDPNNEFSDSADFSSDDEVKPEQEESNMNRGIKTANTSEQEGLTADEVNMKEHFNIVRLTLEQQLEEWKTKEKKEFIGQSLKCHICLKVFAHNNSYKLHMQRHNPIRGSAECPVCKVRFKSEVLARSHENRAHAKKFLCKLCPKAFSNVAVAKKHHKWHSGFLYRCSSCSFTSLHASALGAHRRARHGALTCARCGRAFGSTRGLLLHTSTVHTQESEDIPKYSCQQCDLKFTSEGARRVHILTSKQHKKKTDLCDPSSQEPSLKTTCNKCGIEFPTFKALVEHRRAEHGRSKKKTSWGLPGDSYPTQCDHCDVMVANRSEHWRHVRAKHPAQRSAYRAVITAVCHKCGKGFQNSTKLALHMLRHSAPRVQCSHCPRLFHDSHAVARHASSHRPAHAPRRHRCERCPSAFHQRGNLARHQRVHTGVTPYECSICGKKFKYSTSMNLHTRTVHYKLPHPPRKRKNKKLDESDIDYGK